MKNILLTGGAQGIGRATAERLLKGNKLFVIDKQETDFIKQNTENFTFFLQDIAEKAGLQEVIDRLKDVQFDAIINDAGEIYLEEWDKLQLKTWERTMVVNVTAPLYLVHGLRNNLKVGASVVNISSGDWLYGGYVSIAYAASKAALVSLTKSLAVNLGPRNIRVNAITPGWIDTSMGTEASGVTDEAVAKTPLGRNGRPEEVAELLAFLISEQASYLNGAVIAIDGGYSVVDEILKREGENLAKNTV